MVDNCRRDLQLRSREMEETSQARRNCLDDDDELRIRCETELSQKIATTRQSSERKYTEMLETAQRRRADFARNTNLFRLNRLTGNNLSNSVRSRSRSRSRSNTPRRGNGPNNPSANDGNNNPNIQQLASILTNFFDNRQADRRNDQHGRSSSRNAGQRRGGNRGGRGRPYKRSR